ncbi:hypothetical protein [Nostoc sp.]|uniref:hypothetical protein n=1 Tax=Nostoc sp. TaxID=1180 RepID=UPI002FF74975
MPISFLAIASVGSIFHCQTPLLWYTTIIDLLSLCKALGCLDLSQEITIDALNWKNLPYQLASLVSISPSDKTT